MCLASTFNPNGLWAMNTLCNVGANFVEWRDGTGPGQFSALAAAVFVDCNGMHHTQGDAVPSCQEMNDAIASSASSVVNAANVVLVDAFGAPIGHAFP
jgi:hypothetical protein